MLGEELGGIWLSVSQIRMHERAMITGKSWPVHDGTMIEQKFPKRLLYPAC
jgi:hypothetical protein